MQTTTIRRWVSLLSLVLGIASIFLTILFIYSHYKSQSIIKYSTRHGNMQRIKQATDRINFFITMLQPLAESLAQKIEHEGIEKDAIIKQLQTKPVDITGLGVILSPEFNNGQKWAPYFVEYEDKQQLIMLNELEKDTKQYNWYNYTLEHGAGFIPFSSNDPITEQAVVLFTQPIRVNNQLIGIVFATQSAAHLKHVLHTLYLGQDGYWIMTNQDGNTLIHPNTNLVKKRANLEKNARYNNQNEIIPQAISNAKLGKTGSLYYTNPITKNPAWLVYTQIPTIGWHLFGVFDIYKTFANNDITRRQLIHILCALLVTLLCIVTFCISRMKFNIPALWYCSSVATLILAAGIVFLWVITNIYPNYKENINPIRSKIGLYQFLDTLTKRVIPKKFEDDFNYYLRYRYKYGKYVPTGLLIHDINFLTDDQIEFVGIIWQRYFDGIHDDVARGFILQQLTGKPDIIEISRTKEGKRETIVWLVSAKLNQIMNYHNFPFDAKDIQIELSHKEFDKNIILVPDLDSYSILNPSALPGVSQSAHLSGWQLSGSYFGYRIVDYQTTFGMYEYGPFGIVDQADKSEVPELNFVVIAKRYLFETLTINVIALLVIALLLFVLLLIYKRHTVGNLISPFATVLFSTIVAQQYFKLGVPSEEFVYFESFYFIMYAAILVVLIYTLIDFFQLKVRFIEYNNNLISRLLYWPCLFMIILLITLRYLY